MKRLFKWIGGVGLVLLLAACGRQNGTIDSTAVSSENTFEKERTETKNVVKEIELADGVKTVVFGADEISFSVTSTLIISGDNALLVDTKFTKNDGQEIVNYLEKNKLNLTDIFISHGDPDYYFGLEEIKSVYPNVIAKTTPSVAEHITNTVLNKLVVWGEVLQDQKPRNVVLPEIYTEKEFTFEGIDIEIFGSDESRISLYIPQYEMVLGGPTIVSGNHMFLADMSTEKDRERWRDNLVEIRDLKPEIVIPGHTNLAKEKFDSSAIDFSIEYLDKVAELLPTTTTSDELIQKIQDAYPDLQSLEVLNLTGLVLTGEMEWK
ncbi:MBL fold metallo-hydrolase [Enterococcus sp. BWR-S5]|uniref:MBL fold metallo-hydrolase n=1 Tax=Enterococcus sp. BWR-S5 TaxID=2787714 RepID=UPI001922B573|nr:MBL fold metallo-hydrolase [Enterococcus sp. BWR-S5]MBL1226511.1 MBL fold metallo-hydrolase [Enterococcus sp. BWR-S5]